MTDTAAPEQGALTGTEIDHVRDRAQQAERERDALIKAAQYVAYCWGRDDQDWYRPDMDRTTPSSTSP